MILYKQFNFGLASQTFGLVTSSNSLPSSFHFHLTLSKFPDTIFAILKNSKEVLMDRLLEG